MKIVNRVQKAIKNGDFTTARDILNRQSRSFTSTAFGSSFAAESEQNTDLTYADLQKDYGGGRVSRGLIFLELASLSRRGKNLESMLLFDRIPEYSNVENIDIIESTEEQISFIATSLGVVDLIRELKIYTNKAYETIEAKFIEVFRKVRDGTFLRKNNEEVLSMLRKSVRTLKAAKDRAVIT